MSFDLKLGMYILLKASVTRCICCSCSLKMHFAFWKLFPKVVLDIMSAERFCSSLCTSISNSSLPHLSFSHSSIIFLILACKPFILFSWHMLSKVHPLLPHCTLSVLFRAIFESLLVVHCDLSNHYFWTFFGDILKGFQGLLV